MISERLKQHVKRALCSFSMSRFSRFNLSELSCLMYHRVVPPGGREAGYSTFVDLGVCSDAFEAQMQFIANHYNCISLADAIAALEAGKIPSQAMLVTFDDGYRDNMTQALPILEKYSIPATVFVCTGLVDRTAALWWNEHDYLVQNTDRIELKLKNHQFSCEHFTDNQRKSSYLRLNHFFKDLKLCDQHIALEQLRSLLKDPFSYEHLILNWRELRDFARHPLITIGAHTVNHPILRNESPEHVLSELKESRRRLEQELQTPVEFCAFPFGEPAQAAQRESQLAREAGFRAAFSTVFGHLNRNSDLWYLPRIHVANQHTMTDFIWKLRGSQYLATAQEQPFSGL